ncbi:MAG: ubiquinol-cytochrome c reductase iron-sulfur subunit [Elusimicrobia bacterium]|nr:ubiquinol-cytochrome c reductase iron-sulfur subunit [Elusimicrobiota bacterium]
MTENGSPEEGLSRRGFLTWAIAGLGAFIAAALGATGTGYFISPAFGKREEDWVDLGLAKGFKQNEPLKVDFVERKRDAWATVERRSSAWVVTPNGREFVAFNPRCTHLGCPYRWSSEKKEFLCPCHTAVFDIDGRVVSGPPPRPLDRFPTKVVGGRLLIQPAASKEAA